MRRITVIDGHPDQSESHLNHALAERYTRAARGEGHDVRRTTLAHMHVPVLRNVDEFFSPQAPESLRDAQHDIAWADHLVFFFPLWHGSMPALMKAFIEQTFRPGFAMDYGGKNRFPKQLLKGKSARVIVTMGMPAFIYRTMFGDFGVKAFERSTLALCGIRPISETLLGMAGDSRVRAAKYLDLMDALAREDGAPEQRRRSELIARVARAMLLVAASYGAYVAFASTGKTWFRAPAQSTTGETANVQTEAERVPSGV